MSNTKKPLHANTGLQDKKKKALKQNGNRNKMRSFPMIGENQRPGMMQKTCARLHPTKSVNPIRSRIERKRNVHGSERIDHQVPVQTRCNGSRKDRKLFKSKIHRAIKDHQKKLKRQYVWKIRISGIWCQSSVEDLKMGREGSNVVGRHHKVTTRRAQSKYRCPNPEFCKN